MKDRLTAKRIIVLGSTTGIGAATVKRLAQEGAKVCAADINIEGAAKVAAQADGETFAIHVDISDEVAVNRAVDEAVARFGGLDGAHINAADLRVIMEDNDALSVDLAVFDRTVAVNLRGASPLYTRRPASPDQERVRLHRVYELGFRPRR